MLSAGQERLSNLAHVNPFTSTLQLSWANFTEFSSLREKIKSHLLCLNLIEDKDQKHHMSKSEETRIQQAPYKNISSLPDKTLCHSPEPPITPPHRQRTVGSFHSLYSRPLRAATAGDSAAVQLAHPTINEACCGARL